MVVVSFVLLVAFQRGSRSHSLHRCSLISKEGYRYMVKESVRRYVKSRYSVSLHLANGEPAPARGVTTFPSQIKPGGVIRGRATLIGEKAQATLRGRPRGRLGIDGSGKGCLRGRPRGRLGSGELAPATLRGRPGLLGSTQATGATLYINSSRRRQM